MNDALLERELTHSIIGAFYEVYRHLGYGHLEQLHLLALERELRWLGHEVGREVPYVVHYKDQPLGLQRLDLVVDRRVIVEAKATAVLSPYASRQLLGYLSSTGLQVGLLLHFGPKPVFRRLVNTVRRPSARHERLANEHERGESGAG